MPTNKLTPKQENFVRAIWKGQTQRQAYKANYNTKNMSDEVVDVKACELMKNGKVAVRLHELQERAARSTQRTVESIDQMLDEAYELARGDEDRWPNPAAMINAAIGIAKLHGLIIDKKSIDHGGTVTMKHEDALAKLEAIANRNQKTIEVEAIEIEPASDVRH
jgi:hypothetical protein